MHPMDTQPCLVFALHDPSPSRSGYDDGCIIPVDSHLGRWEGRNQDNVHDNIKLVFLLRHVMRWTPSLRVGRRIRLCDTDRKLHAAEKLEISKLHGIDVDVLAQVTPHGDRCTVPYSMLPAAPCAPAQSSPPTRDRTGRSAAYGSVARRAALVPVVAQIRDEVL